jgi:hypothetical protein
VAETKEAADKGYFKPLEYSSGLPDPASGFHFSLS